MDINYSLMPLYSTHKVSWWFTLKIIMWKRCNWIGYISEPNSNNMVFSKELYIFYSSHLKQLLCIKSFIWDSFDCNKWRKILLRNTCHIICMTLYTRIVSVSWNCFLIVCFSLVNPGRVGSVTPGYSYSSIMIPSGEGLYSTVYSLYFPIQIMYTTVDYCIIFLSLLQCSPAQLVVVQYSTALYRIIQYSTVY